MKLTCPACGAICSAEAWLSDANARQALKIVGEMPRGISTRVLDYLALFRRGTTGRGITWGKALSLLSELSDLIREPYIQWEHDPARPNTPGAWEKAIDQICRTPPKRLPLTSHGYLKRTAYQFADQTDKKAEVKHNQQERNGTLRPVRTVKDPAHQPFKPNTMTAEEMREVRNQSRAKHGLPPVPDTDQGTDQTPAAETNAPTKAPLLLSPEEIKATEEANKTLKERQKGNNNGKSNLQCVDFNSIVEGHSARK